MVRSAPLAKAINCQAHHSSDRYEDPEVDRSTGILTMDLPSCGALLLFVTTCRKSPHRFISVSTHLSVPLYSYSVHYIPDSDVTHSYPEFTLQLGLTFSHLDSEVETDACLQGQRLQSVSRSFLLHLDDTRPFVVEVDTSNVGTSVIPSQ